MTEKEQQLYEILGHVPGQTVQNLCYKSKTKNMYNKNLTEPSKMFFAMPSDLYGPYKAYKIVLEQQGVNNSGGSVALGTDRADSDKQNTRLDPFTKDDCDVIQTHRP